MWSSTYSNSSPAQTKFKTPPSPERATTCIIIRNLNNMLERKNLAIEQKKKPDESYTSLHQTLPEGTLTRELWKKKYVVNVSSEGFSIHSVL